MYSRDNVFCIGQPLYFHVESAPVKGDWVNDSVLRARNAVSLCLLSISISDSVVVEFQVTALNTHVPNGLEQKVFPSFSFQFFTAMIYNGSYFSDYYEN